MWRTEETRWINQLNNNLTYSIMSVLFRRKTCSCYEISFRGAKPLEFRPEAGWEGWEGERGERVRGWEGERGEREETRCPDSSIFAWHPGMKPLDTCSLVRAVHWLQATHTTRIYHHTPPYPVIILGYDIAELWQWYWCHVIVHGTERPGMVAVI